MRSQKRFPPVNFFPRVTDDFDLGLLVNEADLV